MMRRLVSGMAAVLLLCPLLAGCRAAKEITVIDTAGNSVAVFSSMDGIAAAVAQPGYRAYVEIAAAEAVAWIAETQSCTEEEARDRLFSRGYTLHTALDPAVQAAAEAAFAEVSEATAYGCAVTDLSGRLLAAVSSGTAENYAAAKTAPYSALKPLSVYAPALEAGLINWSTPYEDSPVKQVAGTGGQTTDWPQNATGTYSYEPESVANGIKQSINTVAVRCLQQYGVKQSIAFLQESFGIPLKEEQNKAAVYGGEEVLANLALGYLEVGVSPVDMAGYYQTFATGGVYTPAGALVSVTDETGETVYQAQHTGKQVLSETTAALMNRLLQTVAEAGGTGAAATFGEVPVGGKTGTGTANAGNWFVGFTPQYSCAVWQGAGVEKNDSPARFAAVMQGLVHDPAAAFPTAPVRERLYCCESGLGFGGRCLQMDIGYYAAEQALPVCDKH